jgi:hypothetical protein
MEARRRADHLVAGLIERLPELTAGAEASDVPQERAVAPERDVAGVRASETFVDRLWRGARRAIGRS